MRSIVTTACLIAIAIAPAAPAGAEDLPPNHVQEVDEAVAASVPAESIVRVQANLAGQVEWRGITVTVHYFPSAAGRACLA